MKFHKIKYKLFLLFVLIVVINFNGCNYSFTGSSVPSHLNTIAIPIVVDRSGSGETNLTENFTNELILKFTDDNTLQVADKAKADALLECTILSVVDAPAVVSGGENITQRRLTVTVKVNYRDMVERKKIFDRNFSDFGDYKNEGDILTAKAEAINVAIDKITEDILLGVVSNW